MFYKKKGFPEEGDVVLCTVKKILHDSVFADLDEYEKREGIIHISEISPGRIRTVREFVRENKKIICLVLRVNQERNHIELSLRRATKSVQIEKNKQLQLDKKCEKILELVAKNLKIQPNIIKNIGYQLIEKYDSLNESFKILQEKPDELSFIDKKILNELTKLISTLFKPSEVKISHNLTLKSRASDGILIIKNILLKAIKQAEENKQNLEILYLGSPNYRLIIKSTDYKKAQQELDNIKNFIAQEAKKNNCELTM